MVDTDRSVIEVAFSAADGPLFPDEGETDATRGDEAGPEVARTAASRRSFAGGLSVVTGASGLLGSEVVAELVDRGSHVCLIGRDVDALRETVAALGPDARVAMLRCDLASADDVASACDFVDRIGIPLDMVVHAAGLVEPSTVGAGSVEQLDEHYLLEVRGPFQLTQRLLPALSATRGSIVFFADEPAPGADRRPGGDVHRAISQAAVAALAAELRAEVRPAGVRVLTVRTDDDPVALGAGAEGGEFLRSCAAAVLDALEVESLDLAEVTVRRRRVARTEQR